MHLKCIWNTIKNTSIKMNFKYGQNTLVEMYLKYKYKILLNCISNTFQIHFSIVFGNKKYPLAVLSGPRLKEHPLSEVLHEWKTGQMPMMSLLVLSDPNVKEWGSYLTWMSKERFLFSFIKIKPKYLSISNTKNYSCLITSMLSFYL
jgi:hypothetical protein